MPDVEFTNLLIVVVIALLAPLTLGLAPRLRLPAVVLEIVTGIVVGPQALGWVEVDLPVSIVSLLGLAFLLFLAGLEIDVHQLRGQMLHLALLGYAATLVLGIAVGTVLEAVGWVKSPGLVAVTLSATSLGLVVPVLKDAGRVDSRLGQIVVAAASVADFAAIVLLSLLFSTSDASTGSRLVLLVSFAALIAATAVAATVVARSKRLTTTLTTLQDTTAQIRVRAAVVLLVAFVTLAEQFGLESILGAFMAGAVVGLVDRDSASHPHFRTKLEAIGYGFLIPVFFVSSGMRLDLSGLMENPAALARVPLFLAALLAVRGLPALLFSRLLDRRTVIAAGLLQATSLPFVVTATQIGVLTGLMSGVTAAGLVCAGLLSVMVFPAVALLLLRSPQGDRPVSGSS
ncbi:cation:proton antiporter [Aeromicrobium sp. 9AM]|uniref:cation:proton antiporter n=1 Tax=Aeromicrobium sp. 9AM TaxID=2653126 RepID=UPI0012F2E1F9|nr:cation:proton antiporter [Aeromicrobium sp. 9AM]VXC24155.1 Sodium:proton antiporter [Aeromicrobium sp. 9AM]